MTKLKKSWLESANNADTPFPLNNLPYGAFQKNGEVHCGVAIGDFILDLTQWEAHGHLTLDENPVFQNGSWNAFMALGPIAWRDLRDGLIEALAQGSAQQDQVESFLVEQSSVSMVMPIEVAEFTDFYAGRHHATNVGTLFRGAENALPPNWLHIPIGYNGRASTVVVSGTDIHRPCGQTKAPNAELPSFGPSQRLDIELEMGAIVGQPTEMGERISVEDAQAMIFGFVLLNDWSARDIQAWEYQPLGPFQAKSFATSISPWIVSPLALEPFRCAGQKREIELLPHLREAKPNFYDVGLSVSIASDGGDQETISQTNYRELTYSAAQQLAHHASSGCAMRVGDLLGSGTISGTERDACGSFLEMTWGGDQPLKLKDGRERCFLEDGDTITLSGAAKGDGYTIGFGSVSGKILPALP